MLPATVKLPVCLASQFLDWLIQSLLLEIDSVLPVGIGAIFRASI